MARLKPLNDYVFKKLMGEKGSEEILRSFLSAVLGKNLKSVTILENRELTPEVISDKLSILDVRAVTDNNTEIDIEVQLQNQKNMDRRSLFYWSRIFASSLDKGGKYNKLPNVITINILDFEFTALEKYHTVYHLWEDTERHLLTNALEIHFIEMPKYAKLTGKDIVNDSLQRWLTFLSCQTEDEILEELMSMDGTIRKASDKLSYLATDKKFLHELHLREIALSDYNSAIDDAKQEGRQEGENQKAVEIATNLLKEKLPLSIITKSTGLSEEEISKIEV